MKPRANFECRSCEKTIEDLPTECTRCPICGKKRGFRRLFDTLHVARRRPRPARILEGKQDAHKYIDEQMRPAYDRHRAKKASAERFAEGIKEVNERIYEQATPEQRQQINEHTDQQTGLRRMNIPAAQAFGAIDAGGRHDSAVFNYPALKRRVQPLWQK